MAWATVAIANAGLGLASGYFQGEAAKDAASQQRDAANNASQMQWNMYQQGREDLSPYRQLGLSAVDTLRGYDAGFTENEARRKFLEDKIKTVQGNQEYWKNVLNGSIKTDGEREGWQGNLNTSNKEFEQYSAELAGLKNYGPARTGLEQGQAIVGQDPGYNFRLDQGNRSINAAAAARGHSMGGRAMKELTRYGSDYASNEYGNAYQRLMQMAGMGQNSAAGAASMAQNYGQQYGQNQAAIGNANAAGTIGQGNAWSGGLQGLGNGLMYSAILKGQQPAGGVSTQVQPYQGYGSAGHTIPVLDWSTTA
jgi:hypothetical protein